MSVIAADVVSFWERAGPEKWFAKSPAFDEALRLRFEPVHHAAARGAHDDWVETPKGALALVLLFDQIPRNLYRNSPHAFATDPLARAVAVRALEAGFHGQIEPPLRQFLFLPFEHSESLLDQDRAVTLYEAEEDAEGVRWASVHRDIIVRFGRFPHRNRALGRVTTPDEQAFLEEGGFAG